MLNAMRAFLMLRKRTAWSRKQVLKPQLAKNRK